MTSDLFSILLTDLGSLLSKSIIWDTWQSWEKKKQLPFNLWMFACKIICGDSSCIFVSKRPTKVVKWTHHFSIIFVPFICPNFWQSLVLMHVNRSPFISMCILRDLPQQKNSKVLCWASFPNFIGSYIPMEIFLFYETGKEEIKVLQY
jgi:hypothetical protein